MIEAIAGLSVFGGSLVLAKAAVARAGEEYAQAIDSVNKARGAHRSGRTWSATGTGDPQTDAAASAPAEAQADEPVDTVELSPQAIAQAQADAANQFSVANAKLSEEQQQQLEQLHKRDQEVRAHEAAHKAAGGQYAGSASFTYQTGPDGQQYAIGGEVPIDLSPVPGDPEATIAKMEQARAAAMAPATPSGADLEVAAKASQIEQQARAEEASGSAKGSGNGQPGQSGAENYAPGAMTAYPSETDSAFHIDVYA